MKIGRAIVSIALAAAVLLIAGRLCLSDQSFSPANPSWDGLSSLSSGADVRLLHSFDDLAGGTAGDTLLIVGPTEPFSGPEAGVVSGFVDGGGRLVLMDDYGTGNDLLSTLGWPVAIGSSPLCQDLDYYKRASFPVIGVTAGEGLLANVGSLVLNHPAALQVGDTAQVLASTTDKAWLDQNDDARISSYETFGTFPVAARFAHGRGEVIVLSDADLLINGMLDKGDNSGLLENILRSGTVYVDSAHGQQVPLPASLYFTVKGSLAAQAICALLVLLVVYLGVSGGRVFARLWLKDAPAGPAMSGKERLLALMKRQPVTDREMRELNKKL